MLRAFIYNTYKGYTTPKSHLYNTKKSPIQHQKVTYTTPKSHLFTPLINDGVITACIIKV